MVNAILGLLTGLVGWLVSNLPLSPFANVRFDVEGFAGSGVTVGTLMGWVNWLIPFQACLVVFSAWLVAALVVVAVRIATKPITSVIEHVMQLG